MLFNSYVFFAFLIVFLAVYYPLMMACKRTGKIWILACSYVFYSWVYPPYILLLLFSTIVDFICGRQIGTQNSKSGRINCVILSVVLNLGMLGFFKYANFFLECAGHLLPFQNQFFIDVILPVGISFYTFQSMSYTIDVYRGKIRAERSFLNFAVYVSFFPQLVAGPIVFARNFLFQLHSKPTFGSDSILRGGFFVIYGFFLKSVIADNLALSIDAFFANPSAYDIVSSWVYCYSYSIQIFCDFAGYSYIAIGLGKIIGYQLPPNSIILRILWLGMAKRVSVFQLGRKPNQSCENLPESHDMYVTWRTLAWGEHELCLLGRHSRFGVTLGKAGLFSLSWDRKNAASDLDCWKMDCDVSRCCVCVDCF